MLKNDAGSEKGDMGDDDDDLDNHENSNTRALGTDNNGAAMGSKSEASGAVAAKKPAANTSAKGTRLSCTCHG
eukprot:4807574-Alexandrium_andersonii.AAC.1